MKNNGDSVIGIDPGLSETGWAVLGAGPRLIASGCIKTSPRTPFPERLRELHDGLTKVLKEYNPSSAAIEEMFFVKVAHTIRATLQARGVILLAVAHRNVPMREFNPKQVKIALTGSGAAQKPQMQKMVQAALKLKSRLTPDDVADAAAIALCHQRQGRIKNFVVLDRIGGKG
ncbi:MAG: crossover junction endodeoxyribonuclease RuvC [Elusimicrobiota bacterium]